MQSAQTSNYLYSGPPSGVTLDDGQEVLLYPGKTYALPSANPYVLALADQGHLSPAPAKPAPKAEPKSNKSKAAKENP